MRIVIDAPQLAPHITGTDRISHNVLRELQEIDPHNVYEVRCFEGDEYVPSVLTSGNFHVRFDRRTSRLDPAAFPGRVARYARRRRRPPAVMYSFHNMSGPLPLLKTCPTAVSVWDLVPLEFPRQYHPNVLKRLLYRRRAAWAARHGDHFVALSHFSKKSLTTRFGIRDEEVTIMYLAAERRFTPQSNESVARVRARYGLPERFILSIGSTEPRKNVISVVKAYQRLPAELRSSVGLVVIGPQWHGETTRSWGISQEDHIRFTGYVEDEDLPAIYSGADVFAFLSLYEGFGLPPLEAMACGTPVICSNRTSLPEVVGDAGVLADPKDLSTVSRELEALIRNQTRRREVQVRGLERAKRFSWRRAAERLHQVFLRFDTQRAEVSCGPGTRARRSEAYSLPRGPTGTNAIG